MKSYIRTRCTKCQIPMQHPEDYLDAPELCVQCEHEFWEAEQRKLAKEEEGQLDQQGVLFKGGENNG